MHQIDLIKINIYFITHIYEASFVTKCVPATIRTYSIETLGHILK